jgi:hypothetical protein
VQVYALHTLGATFDPREHLAQRGGRCIHVDGSARDVREEGMKNHVVFLIEQTNLALGSAQLLAKSFCELYRAKSTSDDDHFDWLHVVSPMIPPIRKPASLREPARPSGNV